MTSHSPVCIPARTRMPSSPRSRRSPGAADAAGRSVEAHHEPVAERLHLAAAEAPQRVAHAAAVALEHLAPALVAEASRGVRGVDDVGEQDRREHAIGLGHVVGAGEELLHQLERPPPPPTTASGRSRAARRAARRAGARPASARVARSRAGRSGGAAPAWAPGHSAPRRARRSPRTSRTASAACRGWRWRARGGRRTARPAHRPGSVRQPRSPPPGPSRAAAARRPTRAAPRPASRRSSRPRRSSGPSPAHTSAWTRSG